MAPLSGTVSDAQALIHDRCGYNKCSREKLIYYTVGSSLPAALLGNKSAKADEADRMRNVQIRWMEWMALVDWTRCESKLKEVHLKVRWIGAGKVGESYMNNKKMRVILLLVRCQLCNHIEEVSDDVNFSTREVLVALLLLSVTHVQQQHNIDSVLAPCAARTYSAFQQPAARAHANIFGDVHLQWLCSHPGHPHSADAITAQQPSMQGIQQPASQQARPPVVRAAATNSAPQPAQPPPPQPTLAQPAAAQRQVATTPADEIAALRA
ncbi:uncharacterized protein EDB91DRAFT_1079458 [Suillus paluster]|uniref:uncharacterized protein n=1 Tax=Suillus paluster TaxID=48578 RepID=UPI001B8719A6|nr:uncharacterized protein EDB91DRAFT_1079458 [Suillus paluster]KAG1748513.1 hypothetical protein EDB91DRAFT_1079458 [Suillus paluster]